MKLAARILWALSFWLKTRKISLFATLFAVVGIASVSHYLFNQAKEETLADLRVIAQLKANEIERWLSQQRTVTIQPESGYLATAFAAWQTAPTGAERDARLREHMRFYLQRHAEASRIILVDVQGRFALSSDPAQTLVPALPGQVGSAVQLVDFYLNAAGKPRLGFMAPLAVRQGGVSTRIGALIIELDPQRELYPYLLGWPGSSSTGENLLYRPLPNGIEYLSPLRFAAIRPLDRKPYPASEARISESLRFKEYAAEGRNFRNEVVLRAVYPVRGTSWLVSATLTGREAYARAWRNSVAFGLGLIVLMVVGLRLLAVSRARLAEAVRLVQQTRDAKLLRDVVDAVPESMILLDAENHIELINQAGALRLRRKPEDLLGLNPLSMLPPRLAETRGQMLAKVRHAGEPLEFTDERAGMELLNHVYPASDGEKLVIVAMDITQRNTDARSQREATQTLQGFIDHLPGPAYVKDLDSRVLLANRRFHDLLGIDPERMIGKLSSEIFPGEFGEKIVADDKRILANGQTETVTESFKGRYYESTKFVIPRDNGLSALGGITLDVTERIVAEQARRESESRLQHLANNIPDSYLYQIVVEPDGSRHFLHVGTNAERIHGIPLQTILADPSALYATIDPTQMAQLEELETRSRTELGDFSMGIRMRQANGQYGDFMVRSRPRVAEAGRLIWDGIVTDVTRLRQNERELALQASRARALLELPAIAEQSDEVEFMSRAQDIAEQLTGSQIGFIHFINDDQETIELVNWSHNTLAHFCHAVSDKHYPLQQAGIWADAARQKKAVVFNDYAMAPGKRGLPEGHSTLLRLICVPVIENGKVRMLAGVGNKPEDYVEADVETMQLLASETWRILRKRRIETALALTAQVVEASPAICFRWSLDKGWPVRFVSDNVRRWGYEPEELVAGRPSFSSLIHADDLSRISAEVRDYVARGVSAYTQEYRLTQANGDVIWVSDFTSVIRDTQGQAIELYGVITDISERKHHELKLAENLAAQRELNMRLEEAHNQLLQAEKLSAIGQLAAGVAHELNNPIGFVSSNLGTLGEYVAALVNLCDTYTTLIDDQQNDSPQLTEIRRIKQDQDYNYLRADVFPLLEESREGLHRMRKIVQDLRDFSRTGDQGWEVADLHKGLDSTLNIVANELKYKCSVHKEYGVIPEVLCIVSQLNQVFMNLLVNAAQAMETPGVITLKSGMEDAEHVWLSISDTGQGIKPEHLNRIFDPFFTTKPVGIGTGLGLSLVFGIINRHHGHIEVSSQPGQGTTFRIVLPIHPVETTLSLPAQEAS